MNASNAGAVLKAKFEEIYVNDANNNEATHVDNMNALVAKLGQN